MPWTFITTQHQDSREEKIQTASEFDDKFRALYQDEGFQGCHIITSEERSYELARSRNPKEPFDVLKLESTSSVSDSNTKFHLNVAPEDVPNAWAIVARHCMENSLSGMKVVLAGQVAGMTVDPTLEASLRYEEAEEAYEQSKKKITLYARKSLTAEQQLAVLRSITAELQGHGIEPLSHPSLDVQLEDIQLGSELGHYFSLRVGEGVARERREHCVLGSGHAYYPYQAFLSANMLQRDRDGQTKLHRAVALDDEKLIKKLLAAGANIEARDNDGMTPLAHAFSRNNLSTIDVLLEYRADTSVVDNKGRTLLHFAADSNAHVFCYNLEGDSLSQFETQVNIQDESGQTPLHKAADTLQGAREMIEWLVVQGADIKAKDKKEHLPYIYAKAWKQGDMVLRLLSTGFKDEEKAEYDKAARKLWGSSSSRTETASSEFDSQSSSGDESSGSEEQESDEFTSSDSSTSDQDVVKPTPEIPSLRLKTDKLTQAAVKNLRPASPSPSCKKAEASSSDTSEEESPTQSSKRSPGSRGQSE